MKNDQTNHKRLHIYVEFFIKIKTEQQKPLQKPVSIPGASEG